MEHLPVPHQQKTIIIDEHTTLTYDDSLERAGAIADAAASFKGFAAYHATISPNTRRRQQNELANFSEYLAEAGIERTPWALYTDPEAWRGMSYGLLKGFQEWLLQREYSTGGITVATATIHQYCKLAGPPHAGAGVLTQEALAMILGVKGFQGKAARNIDTEREKVGLKTRRGKKKAQPTRITAAQALKVKTTTLPTQSRRRRDALLAARDALLAGLLVEHALRCSEVAALDIENLDLMGDQLRIYHQKTNEYSRHVIKKHTRMAAHEYLTLLKAQGITAGPLFRGYKGGRLSTRAINQRIAEIGQALGIVGRLSPHDLRHFWTRFALKQGTPIDRVKQGGNWKSNDMVLRYAGELAIANEGVIVVGEEEEE